MSPPYIGWFVFWVPAFDLISIHHSLFTIHCFTGGFLFFTAAWYAWGKGKGVK